MIFVVEQLALAAAVAAPIQRLWVLNMDPADHAYVCNVVVEHVPKPFGRCFTVTEVFLVHQANLKFFMNMASVCFLPQLPS